MVLNKYVDHMKAANSQTVQEQNTPGSSTAFPTVLEPMGLSSSLCIEGISESEMDTVDVAGLMSLPPEEENKFLLRLSRSESHGVIQ
eukprot:g30817.t1